MMLRFALRFAAYDRAKSFGVILGIMVSTFLIGQQLGIFLFHLMESSVMAGLTTIHLGNTQVTMHHFVVHDIIQGIFGNFRGI